MQGLDTDVIQPFLGSGRRKPSYKLPANTICNFFFIPFDSPPLSFVSFMALIAGSDHDTRATQLLSFKLFADLTR